MASAKFNQTIDCKKNEKTKPKSNCGFRQSQKNMTTPKGGGFSS